MSHTVSLMTNATVHCWDHSWIPPELSYSDIILWVCGPRYAESRPALCNSKSMFVISSNQWNALSSDNLRSFPPLGRHFLWALSPNLDLDHSLTHWLEALWWKTNQRGLCNIRHLILSFQTHTMAHLRHRDVRLWNIAQCFQSEGGGGVIWCYWWEKWGCGWALLKGIRKVFLFLAFLQILRISSERSGTSDVSWKLLPPGASEGGEDVHESSISIMTQLARLR